MITEEIAFWLGVLGVVSAIIIIAVSVMYYLRVSKESKMRGNKTATTTVYSLVFLNLGILILVLMAWLFLN